MKRLLSTVVLISLFAPTFACAAPASITRREGYLLIWKSIQRPAEQTRETPYADVPLSAPGGLEITFGKARGFLADSENFFPDSPLSLRDAVLMILRTRNVDDPDLLTSDNLPELLERFPFPTLLSKKTDLSGTVTEEELASLIVGFDQMLRSQEHETSFYSEKFHGKGTAFGESFDMYAMTAAHRTYPHNTLVKVTNIANGKSVTVRINDRGPFVKGRDMDLSLGAFTTIAERSKGKIMATFERLGDTRIIGPCSQEPRMQLRLAGDVRFRGGIPSVLRLGDTLNLGANKTFTAASVTYPDGQVTQWNKIIPKGQTFTFKPAVEGEYAFAFKTENGRKRVTKMVVARCD